MSDKYPSATKDIEGIVNSTLKNLGFKRIGRKFVKNCEGFQQVVVFTKSTWAPWYQISLCIRLLRPGDELYKAVWYDFDTSLKRWAPKPKELMTALDAEKEMTAEARKEIIIPAIIVGINTWFPRFESLGDIEAWLRKYKNSPPTYEMVLAKALNFFDIQ